ncbi:NmrA family NAD(P)-binding protein [Niabella aquatica]
MRIAITGSLGHIGRPLCQLLIENGHLVIVISSNAEKRYEIEKLGATPSIGSLEDIAFMKIAFAGADAAFCMIPPSYTQPDQIAYYKKLGANYKAAIVETGVKRVVHLSSYGAHLPSGTGFIAGSYQVEQILNTIPGIQLTHLRPTSFYYNLLAFIPMIRTAGFIGAVYGDNDQVALASPKDIAEAAAEELVKGSNIHGVRYVGSDDRTCNEIATVIGNAIDKPDLKWVTLPKQDVLNNLKKTGLPDEYCEKLIELGDAIHTGKLREDYDLHQPQPGKVKLEEFAEEFARAFTLKK